MAGWEAGASSCFDCRIRGYCASRPNDSEPAPTARGLWSDLAEARTLEGGSEGGSWWCCRPDGPRTRWRTTRGGKPCGRRPQLLTPLSVRPTSREDHDETSHLSSPWRRVRGWCSGIAGGDRRGRTRGERPNRIRLGSDRGIRDLDDEGGRKQSDEHLETTVSKRLGPNMVPRWSPLGVDHRSNDGRRGQLGDLRRERDRLRSSQLDQPPGRRHVPTMVSGRFEDRVRVGSKRERRDLGDERQREQPEETHQSLSDRQPTCLVARRNQDRLRITSVWVPGRVGDERERHRPVQCHCFSERRLLAELVAERQGDRVRLGSIRQHGRVGDQTDRQRTPPTHHKRSRRFVPTLVARRHQADLHLGPDVRRGQCVGDERRRHRSSCAHQDGIGRR